MKNKTDSDFLRKIPRKVEKYRCMSSYSIVIFLPYSSTTNRGASRTRIKMEVSWKTKKVKVAQGGARMVEIGKTFLYGVPGLERKNFKFLKFRKRHSTRDMLFGFKNPIIWTPPVLAPKDKTTEN